LETSVQESTATGILGPCDRTTDIGVEFRHSGWRGRRQRVLEAFERIDPLSSRAARFAACGRNAWVMQSVSDPDVYRVACSKCHDRLCQPCASARSRRVAARVAELSKNREIRFLTLTLRINDAPLGDQVTRLLSCFARLRRRVMWKRSQTGGVAFLELKRRAESHTWHPHIHAIIEGTYLDKKVISRAWHELTGDSFIVKIKLCDSSERAAYYAAKYSGKAVHGGVENDPDMLDEAIQSLKGRRLLTCFGDWRFPSASDDLYPDEWRTVGTLRSVLERSHGGDPSARGVVACLTGIATCDLPGHDPPVPDPVRVAHDAQRSAWYDSFPF
ncbi:hypothetical protein LCGC14_1358150, partial [marine sediment metagenome]